MIPGRSLVFAAALFGAAPALHADVKLPAIFGDHMVLQEGIPVPVWGTAAPGEQVTISVGANTAQATADGKGNWQAVLPPLTRPPDSAKSTTLTVRGKNFLTLTDVLIGDVWLCSGQSNMEFPVGAHDPPEARGIFTGASNAATALPAAHDPQLRLFLVQRKTALHPESDVVGKWQVCSPESVEYFSAVGYFFGCELRQKLAKPIGLIGSYYGGSPIEAFMSLSALQKDPAFHDRVDLYQKHVAEFAAKSAAYPALLAAWERKIAGIQKSGLPPDTRWPKPPVTPDGGHWGPTNLFHGMIAPIIPYAIKGVIWYQGEKDASRPVEYHRLFPALIADWRAQWHEGDFPFLFVQLPRYQSNPHLQWAFLREAQLQTLSVPHTGMAIIYDIGDPDNAHPKDKVDVAHRLALVARHVAYGEDLVDSGPIYDSMKVNGNTVTLAFQHAGSGLVIGLAPWVADGFAPISTTSLAGFTIAGADDKFVPAQARIVGDTVVVSSPRVAKPVAVRYAWANTTDANLFNKENLPASPFRTDALSYQPPTDNPDPAP